MDMGNRKTQFNIWYWIVAFVGLMIFQYVYTATQHVAQIPYSQFETLLRDGQIADVQVSDRFIQGRFKQPQDGKPLFITTRVEPNLARQLQEHGVTVTGQIESTFLSDLLSWIVPILVFFGLWMLLMRRMAGGMGGLMQIGRSKARVYVEANTGVSFDDVAGVDEAKAELQEIVDFLKSPQEYGRLGGRMPKGVLLVGPPGTGKTLLAKAVAGEAKVPFFSISGSEFVEMFVGVGAARVRDLFEQARAKAPAIIFIDELDALGRARGAGPTTGGHDEKEQTLNQLLVELDGFDPKIGVVLLAATNRPEILDPALLRAGRFDRQVLVDRPDKQGRVQILKVNAVERIVAGLEKRNRLLNPREREVVAYHEMGHALVAMALPGVDPVHKVSIIPRGVGALGYTIQRPTEDRFLMTREELENKMAVLLGGRAAEWIVFGHLSTGAADDLAKVTDIARAMVTRYGMSEKLGHVALEKDQRSFLSPNPLAGGPREHDYGEATAEAIDEEVRGIVDTAFSRTVGLLTERRDLLEKTARKLLEIETLSEAELASLVGNVATPDRTAASEPQSGKRPIRRGKAAATNFSRRAE
ncbi:MAG: ATP-dependent metallopeptidase FtsH/Yme1/Tma family protein [Mesorhizobium sp.]|uniref:ATP-dependent metallopeptidase FtsH/Yme1/Tma family protein n=1 Tax=Mesorhizobium sp. TaxID=1871066 RepID=UPI000FE9A696|nr:FtsH/Yme1/Tma family ATP-dependent metallopeptidase [Mesorhizobium sp.]RWQ47830.1 MAG: ATP-dependent metallopeptidase FtsH/Yme1/Tma family protein [Mesorhizobium sp.]